MACVTRLYSNFICIGKWQTGLYSLYVTLWLCFSLCTCLNPPSLSWCKSLFRNRVQVLAFTIIHPACGKYRVRLYLCVVTVAPTSVSYSLG